MSSGLWAEQYEAEPYAYSEIGAEGAWFKRELAVEASLPVAQAQQKARQHGLAYAQLTAAIRAMHRHVRQRDGQFHFAGSGRNPRAVAASLRIPPQIAI